MIGTRHLPDKLSENTFVFYATSPATALGNFQSWTIPPGVSALHFTVIGSGGGGGSGNTGTLRLGGGGGAPGGIVSVVVPRILLPDTLYLHIGQGGAGATSVNSLGQAGIISYVCIYPELNGGSILIRSSVTRPGGGPGDSTGGFGASPTITTGTSFLEQNTLLGLIQAQTAATGAPTNTNTAYAGLLTGGTRGGGTTSGGSGVSGLGISMSAISDSNAITSIPGGVGTGGTAGNGGDGSPGYFSWSPFMATGGTGGGGGRQSIGNSFKGGNGGKGAFGCGGGGGGACGAASGTPTHGNGGDGGDGLIIITVM